MESKKRIAGAVASGLVALVITIGSLKKVNQYVDKVQISNSINKEFKEGPIAFGYLSSAWISSIGGIFGAYSSLYHRRKRTE